VREPLIVLSEDFHVKMVNKAFCRTFQVTPVETANQPLETLGNGQWKIPQLRSLLEKIVLTNSEIHDFEVDHTFPDIGYRAMLINARRLEVAGKSKPLILLAIEDVTLRRQAEQAMTQQYVSLEHNSMTDELTGLCNRRGFLTLGRRFLEIAHQRGKGLFVVFMDLDGLKRINDEGGHSKGDDALKNTAEILTMTFRKSDIMARLGGDEFAVITMEHGRDSASRLIARLQYNIQLHAVRENYHQPITLSIGIARSDPREACTIEELTTRADALMYVEKRSKPRLPEGVHELLAGVA
jgi:diguanylate cyclase (GGDEF)-like protein